jgi:hypothetical protein
MSQLRNAIARYAAWLDSRAQRHRLFATILTAVAHRLRHILDNTEDAEQETQYAVHEDGSYQLINSIDGWVAGTKICTRTATYTAWKEI